MLYLCFFTFHTHMQANHCVPFHSLHGTIEQKKAAICSDYGLYNISKHFVPNVFFTEGLHAHDGNQGIVSGCGLLQALQTIGYHFIYHALLLTRVIFPEINFIKNINNLLQQIA